MHNLFLCLAGIGFALCLPGIASGKLSFSQMFSSHMVLQQGIPVPVWGTAVPGEEVTVEFAGQRQRTTADADGNWLVKLSPLEASAEPRCMTISGSSNTENVKFSDVLVGEVWFASGQSNMAMPVGNKIRPDAYPGVINFEAEIAAANHSELRLLTINRPFSLRPLREANTSGWQPCTPQSVETFSATAYFFARHLREHLQVPVGVIASAASSTTVEQWTSLEALARFPQFSKVAAFYRDPANAKITLEGLRQGGVDKPPALLFNSGIAPCMPYAIRGVIWYQGESNASRAVEYRQLLPALIRDWRTNWQQGDFPFILVQLAGYQKVPKQPGEDAWAELREAQALTSAQMPSVFLATALDIGMETFIHPLNKQEVGRRLGLLARANVYGKKVESGGPVFKEIKIQGERAILSFDSLGGGLVSRDKEKPGRLGNFAIAGSDRVWHWAQAYIDGDNVIAYSPDVANPVAVRYAWSRNISCDFYNRADLPAFPFRTDDWPLSTADKAYCGQSSSKKNP